MRECSAGGKSAQRQIFQVPASFSVFVLALLAARLIAKPNVHCAFTVAEQKQNSCKKTQPMLYVKLIKVLKTFDSAQLKRLQKFAHSAYFGVYPPSVALLNYLAPLHPQFESPHITFKKVAAFHKKLSTVGLQETAGVRLLRAVEKFMAQEEWQKNPIEVKRYQLTGYKAQQLTDEFERQFEKEMKGLKQSEQNFEILYQKHLLTELSLNGFNAKLNRTTGNDIMPVIKTLDEFHALKKLRYLCEAINRKQFFGTGVQQQEQHIPALLKTLEPYTSPQHPYGYLFLNVYRLLASDIYEDAKLYYALIKKLINQKQGTPSQTCREAMGYAANCLLNWYNKGYEETGDEYLWWMEWKMKHNFLLEDNKLLPITFRNIIAASLNRKTPAQIERLINHYGKYLPQEYSETYLAFAWALQQYTNKNYKKAIQLFMQAQAKEDPVFNSSIRRWQWMCTYDFDANDTDTLLNQLQSFEKYLHRHGKELQYVGPVYKIFINYSYKLLTSTAEDVFANLSALQQTEHFVGRPWLIEKFGIKNKKPVRFANGFF